MPISTALWAPQVRLNASEHNLEVRQVTGGWVAWHSSSFVWKCCLVVAAQLQDIYFNRLVNRLVSEQNACITPLR